MDNREINRNNQGEIVIPANGDKEFFMIHGYTGSTYTFHDLPEILNKSFGAEVFGVKLPGHETKVEDLEGLDLKTYLNFVEDKFLERSKNGKKIVLVGLSFGAQLALYLASKYNVGGVICISMIHKFKFPLNVKGVGLIGIFKKKWGKWWNSEDRELMKSRKCYEVMPTTGFVMTKELSDIIEKRARYIDVPVFSVYSTQEKLASHRGVNSLYNKLSSVIKETYLVSHESHTPLDSPYKKEIEDKIVGFIEDNSLFDNVDVKLQIEEKATAIVPTYNEGPRIAKVLEALEKSDLINEIIVIDDGSTDDTKSIVSSFTKVNYVKNEKNMGKAFGMDRGVKMAKNDLIFFCDADLIDFKTEYADEIIRPVLNRQYDMFVGLRSNFMQRTVQMWALNSGERSLRKDIWHNLPEYYKYRYRVEAGLNYYVANYSKLGMSWKTLNYSQPIKESKYGFLKGTFLRWWMNLDVFSSYLAYPFVKNN